jgi:phosphoglycerate dehydrogenase-like enzyme/sugar (pentulose or hexulose) kinase/ribulose-5-phosphate 4-epimerase/fuculose-1-phosphate aldolase/putative sterol carrier protein
MPHTYLLALDAGGGGGHAVVVDVDDGTVTRAFRPWRHATAPDTSGLGFDFDLEEAWRLLADAATEAIGRAGARPGDVAGIAATSMRHTTVVLDADGTALLATPNRDGRAIAEAFALLEHDPDAHYARTGHWPGPVTTAARLRWLAAGHAADFARATTVFSISDWLAFRLSGERATDPSQASETLLLDVATRAWSTEAATAIGVPARLLPPLLEPGTRLGALTSEAAATLGLAAGIPVAVGGADTQCGLLGAGVVRPGEAAIIAGTTVPVQMVRDTAQRDPAGRLWTCCHVVPGAWVLESNAGPMGETLAWLASVLCPDAPSPVATLLAEAELVASGAGGIVSSLGAQVMNARAIELPIGSLTLTHMTTANDPDRRAHVARAFVDGMAYAVRANLDQLRSVAGADAVRVVFAGGMARSRVVARTLADALGRPVALGSAVDATALGAAICAGAGAGVFADVAEGAARLLGGERGVVEPDAGRTATQETLYAGWTRLRAARTEADAVARELMLPALLQSLERGAPSSATPAERPRILVTAQMDDAALALLRALGDVEYACFRDTMRLLAGDQLVEALAGVAVFVTEVDVVDAAVLDRLPDLRVVVACRADAVNVDAEACAAFGIPVLNAPGRNADAVADLAVAFLLMLARRLPDATTFLRAPEIEAGDMGRMGQAFTQLRGRELWHKTVGLIGFGNVGTHVARRLAGFGARVITYDPYASPERLARGGAEACDLPTLLATSDFVSLHAAVTDETRGMIDAAALAAMQPGACLVNTARAALVDEAALADALRSGRLGGAALDVFSIEPPGSDHPLLALPNVIATPHVAGNTAEIGAHQGEIVATDLGRMLRGERPLHALVPAVLDTFDWHAPRPAPDRAALARLADRPPPAVTDLQRDRATPVHAAAEAKAATVGAEATQGMRRVLDAFLADARDDAALTAFAAGKDVLLRFTLPDVAQHFFLGLRDGRVSAGLGEPESEPDVELRMRAAIFDGIFTGAANAMEAATSGRLSFTGDTLKAMTLQEIQADLTRLYLAARERVGAPGDLGPVTTPRPAAGGAATGAVAPDDPRVEAVHVIEELYAAGLITATGGNVSVRVPGTDEIWITPGQVFKGTLTPEMLVRIDLDGHPLDEGTASPSSERLMHCAVYRARPDAHAVIHAHAPNATVLADAALPFLPVSTEAAFFGDLPRVPFIMPGSQELADAVGAAAATSWAVLMTNHGLLVAGRSLRRAADMAEVIERSAEVILGCHAVGKTPSVLPDEVVERLRKMGDMMA